MILSRLIHPTSQGPGIFYGITQQFLISDKGVYTSKGKEWEIGLGFNAIEVLPYTRIAKPEGL